MYIRGLIPRNFAELPEAVPIGSCCGSQYFLLREIVPLYEGHPIKNETFFIVKKSVCVFS